MRAELVSPATRYAGTISNGTSTEPAWSLMTNHALRDATCSGLGKSAKGRYTLFRCSIAYALFGDTSGTLQRVSAWVRPWSPTMVCITQVNIGTCPPALPEHPLANDPRVCGSPDLGGCETGAAHQAMSAKLHDGGNTTQVNLACAAVTAFVYRCTWGGGTGTVKFTASRTTWSTTVVIGT